MATAALNGITVGYDDVGEGAVLFLVHGHPFDRSMWRPQVEEFGGPLRVIAPDLRGFGATTMTQPGGPWSTYAEDAAALLDHLDVDKVVLAGLSMGGQIAMECYRLYPQRIRALVLADTFAQLDSPDRRQARFDTADRLLREGMARYADDVLPKMIAPRTVEERPAVADHVLRMMRGAPPEGAAAALRARADRPDYTDLLGRIDVPTLIVVGSDDEFTPVADAEFMRERVPGATLAVVDGTGHLPNLERPDQFNDVLRAFLDRVS